MKPAFLIAAPTSGSGKTTIARQVFPDAYFTGYEYKAKSVIDDMPKGVSIKDIEKWTRKDEGF